MVTWLIPALVSLGIGAILFFMFARNSEYTVTRGEFAIGLAVTLLIVTPLTSFFGGKISVANVVGGYHEFLNGSILQAESQRTPCDRDGNCKQTYSCDPYTVMVTKHRSVYAGRDSKGNAQYRDETYQVPETRYHSCPYATEEWTFWTVDSFEDKHVIADGVFAAQPREWRGGSGIPGNVLRGIPPQWQEARTGIDNGDPVAMTKTGTYVNYILSSTTTSLKRYSADIRQYRKAGLLPDPTRNWQDPIHHLYQADKFQLVKGVQSDYTDAEWQRSLEQFNAALGMTLRGDMHVVAVPADKVSADDSERYINALIAYWQGPRYGKWGLGKNTIALAVGVSADGKTVEWVRAKTGMPTGNGEMISALSFLRDVPFTPQGFLGHPRAYETQVKDGKATSTELKFHLGEGVVERIVLDRHPFLRACMDCKDKGDHGSSYTYLKAEVKVSGWAKIWISLVAMLLNGAVWAALWYLPILTPFKPSSDTDVGGLPEFKPFQESDDRTYRSSNRY